mmetsp:Transcript_25148/g.35235  ORF Transcript_25148/g.35235 Transcript_25148/m.35235 type:complete len:96 (-) Transcript_25148:948-1235(-)
MESKKQSVGSMYSKYNISYFKLSNVDFATILFWKIEISDGSNKRSSKKKEIKIPSPMILLITFGTNKIASYSLKWHVTSGHCIHLSAAWKIFHSW